MAYCMYSFIHSTSPNKPLYLPGTVGSTGDTKMNQTQSLVSRALLGAAMFVTDYNTKWFIYICCKMLYGVFVYITQVFFLFHLLYYKASLLLLLINFPTFVFEFCIPGLQRHLWPLSGNHSIHKLLLLSQRSTTSFLVGRK